MQGQRSAIGSLPETLDFTRGPSSGDGLDQPVCWNNLRSPSQNRLPEYIVSPNDASVAYITPTSQERQTVIGWTVGESSSSVAQSHVSENEPKTGHNWPSSMSACPGPSCVPEERRFEPSNILSLNNVDVNLGSRVLPMQGSSSGTLPRDLNRSSGMEEDDTDDDDDDDDDDCQVMEFITAYESGIPANQRISSGGSSSGSLGGSSRMGGFLAAGSDGRPGSSTDGRRLSCKRKALEGHAGPSSGSGSSSYFQHPESSVWNTAATHHNISSSSNIPSPAPNNSGVNLAEQINPRLGLSIGDAAASESPIGITAPRNAENSRRNFRLRINASHQHQHQHQQGSVPRNLFSTETEPGNVSVSSYRNSSRLHCNNSIEFRPTAIAESTNPQGPPIVVHVPSLRRHSQTRWNAAASSSRSGNPANYALSMDRDSPHFDESTSSRAFPRNISQHPMFTPADIGNSSSSQNPTNWGLANGNNCVAGNLASTSRSGSTSGAHSSSPSLAPNRALPQYPRRLSEFVRRSLLTSAGGDSGGQVNNGPQLRASSSAGAPEMALPGNHVHRPSSSRSAMLLERHLDSSFAIPYSWRTLAAAGEGRSRLVSEIHNVLDLMRRGEGLRIEDVMILDQSVLFGMPDAHDRHRDMRLDVDNMSYEELLALEERIGNVCTGLSEEAISSRLKQHKFAFIKSENPEEREPCCVCQEEYNDGEDLGTLDCGHDFHADCIKQWLKHKNLCPVCKTTGLAT